MARNKYHNRPFFFNGKKYPSEKEAYRAAELDMLQKAGEITDLQEQVKFVLIPAQREESEEIYLRGKNKGEKKPGKLLEKECAYLADFVYKDRDGKLVVEDTKGFKTKEYLIKRKLMLFVHGIRIVEV